MEEKQFGVIGTGLDVFYPRSNKQLQKYMSGSHLVLTEYGPGQGPQKHHFPERNRIIAGLSRAVIVAEARMRSGSLITCERAMEEGRDVLLFLVRSWMDVQMAVTTSFKKVQSWSPVEKMS